MQNIQHLVLLVGTNPLPNYVVAKYFLPRENELKKIWLVYSEKIGNQNSTRDLAEKLRNVLNKITGVSFELLPLSDVSSAKKIESDIKEKLIPKLKDGYVHLNYTGGTKAMSVHVYRTLEHELGDRCSFSYLDSRDYILKNDNGQFMSDDLRNEIFISFDDLINLHGCEKVKKNENPKWIEVIEEFEKLIIDNKLKVYLEWANKFLKKVYFANNKFIDRLDKFIVHNQLPQNIDKLNEKFKRDTSNFVMTLLEKIPPEYSIVNTDGSVWFPKNLLDNDSYIERLKPVVEDFLNGKWLEIYVAEIIKRNLKELNTYNDNSIIVEENWEIRKKNARKPFEIDIIAMNGYQLCGISITTSDRELTCKGKVFEILHRVHQLGGSESKAILITCLPKSRLKRFKEDLKTISGATEDKLLVLCESDLRPDELWKNIKRHIWGNLI